MQIQLKYVPDFKCTSQLHFVVSNFSKDSIVYSRFQSVEKKKEIERDAKNAYT